MPSSGYEIKHVDHRPQRHGWGHLWKARTDASDPGGLVSAKSL